MNLFEIVLLIVGAPVWISLLLSAAAVIFSLYVSLWSVVVSLWAVFGALVGGAFGATVWGTVYMVGGNVWQGLAAIGCGFVCLGLSVFVFYGCMAATRGSVWLGKKCVLVIRNVFAKKEGR